MSDSNSQLTEQPLSTGNLNATASTIDTKAGGDSSYCGNKESCTVEPSMVLDLENMSCFAAPTSALPALPPAPRTAPRGNRIARISDETAAAISSQQVVIDLKSICKELVENALDAGATSIEVRLMDCGLGGVEVRDNGTGISSEDLELLGCRHATSKISNFEDIYSKLDSMGFRGEALSSLCFIARVSIVTRCRSVDFGTRVFFDHNGKQVARESTAREVGTTVSVEDIFGRVPLRRRTMEQTKQRQLQDALALLQRIALLHASSCRIVLSNFDPKTGGRSTFLATKGTSSGLLEAALTVYGAKQLVGCTELTLSGDEPGREWRLQAVISRPPHGVRSASLQHFFVKRRAVEFPPLVQKLLNKKWKEVSSRGLFPVCLAFLELDASLFDINVRKDKQQVLLAVEKDIAQALLEAISKILAPSVGSFEFETSTKQRQLTVNICTTSHIQPDSKRQQREYQQEQEQPHEQQRKNNTLLLYSSTEQPRHPQEAEGQQQQQHEQQQAQQQQKQQHPPALKQSSAAQEGYDDSFLKEGAGADGDITVAASTNSDSAKFREGHATLPLDEKRQSTGEQTGLQGGDWAASILSALSPNKDMQDRRPLSVGRRQRLLHRHSEDGGLRQLQRVCRGEQEQQDSQGTCQSPNRRSKHMQHEVEVETFAVTPTDSSSCCRAANLPLDPPAAAQSGRLPPGTDEEADWLAEEILAAAVGECDIDLAELYSVKAHEVTTAPTEVQGPQPARDTFSPSWGRSPTWPDAPADLSLQDDATAGAIRNDPSTFLFRKDFFRDLTLVGQFNEGFIIAALRNTRPARNRRALGREEDGIHTSSSSTSGSINDAEVVTSLFIIDQHASDEKRIFEALNAEFRPRLQPLIAPLKLSLPAELIAAVEAFAPHLTTNGFSCVICGPNGPPRPLNLSQVISAPTASQVSTSPSIPDVRPSTVLLFSLLSQEPQPQLQTRAEGVVSASKKEVEVTWDVTTEEEDSEMDVEGRHCFLTGVPIIEGRQLSATDFIEFLAALASEDQGKAMWKGTMPQPPVRVETKGASKKQRPSPHHRVLQYRPSRVWDILASKACRSAVMIGDPLPPQRQIAIFRRMAGLQLPFNCPHGRPTMRHLVDLSDGIPQEGGCLSYHNSQHNSRFTIEQQKNCREKHAQARGPEGDTRILRAPLVGGVDVLRDEDVDGSYRQKRPAPT